MAQVEVNGRPWTRLWVVNAILWGWICTGSAIKTNCKTRNQSFVCWLNNNEVIIATYLLRMSLTTNPGAKVDSGLKWICSTWFILFSVWFITWLFSWFQCNKYSFVNCSTWQERRNSHFKNCCSRKHWYPSHGRFLGFGLSPLGILVSFHSLPPPPSPPTQNWNSSKGSTNVEKYFIKVLSRAEISRRFN